MKKRFGFYIAFWAVLVALFNVIAFVSVGWIGYEKYSASFWIGYIFITVMFVGQLICALSAIKADSHKKLFYNISLIKTSYAGLIVSFIVGGLCMLISPLPYWIGILVCAIVLAANVLSVIKAAAVVNEVDKVDSKTTAKSFFMRDLAVDAEVLMNSCEGELRAEAKKVYDVIKFSDPMSIPELVELEKQIQRHFGAFETAVRAGDEELVAKIAKDLIETLDKRALKCKMMK